MKGREANPQSQTHKANQVLELKMELRPVLEGDPCRNKPSSQLTYGPEVQMLQVEAPARSGIEETLGDDPRKAGQQASY